MVEQNVALPKTNCGSLIIFSCAGRATLLKETIESIAPLFSLFGQKILSLDGSDQETIQLASRYDFDDVLVSYRRNGYFLSVQRAFAVTCADIFFWIEDDCPLFECPDLNEIAHALRDDPCLAQIRLNLSLRPGCAVFRMPRDSNKGVTRQNLLISDYLYHFHPHFGRTDLMYRYCHDIEFHKATKGHNLEDAVTEWMLRKKMTFGLWYDGKNHAKHIGGAGRSSIPAGQRQYHDVWEPCDLAELPKPGAETSLRAKKNQGALSYAADRHDLRVVKRIRGRILDFISAMFIFPFAIITSPFFYRSRLFLEETRRYWHHKNQG